ncbi:hypothetical protein BDW62DRAFT_200934 [Aspergillus aurantiobrunneus]
MAPPHFVLTPGIELELLLKPTERTDRSLRDCGYDANIVPGSADPVAVDTNRKRFHSALIEGLRVQGLEVGGRSIEYTMWTITDKSALDEIPEHWFYSLTATGRPKLIYFSQIWLCFDIKLTPGCSMHVHVSQENRFQCEDLQKIIKSIIYYDGPVTDIVPPERKNNEWAKSNIDHLREWSMCRPSNPQDSWSRVFNPIDTKRPMGKLIMGLCDDTYLSWNFSNLPHNCGTMEFRRPPAVCTSREANHWVSVALGFISHALGRGDWGQIKTSSSYPSVSGLDASIRLGLQYLGPMSQGALLPVVADKNPAIRATPAELEEINQKKHLKRNKKSLFVEKMESRENSPVPWM